MSSTYNGNAAAITPHLAVAITEPADGDPAAAASVNIAFSKLADYLQWLQQQAALVDSVNGFSVEQAFTAAGSVILLNNALGQIISKIGGGSLQIDNSVGVLQLTSGVGSNAILRSGAAGATLTATPTGLTSSMPLAMGANKITGLAAPTAASSDAATATYSETVATNAAKARVIGCAISLHAAGPAVERGPVTVGWVGGDSTPYYRIRITFTNAFSAAPAVTLGIERAISSTSIEVPETYGPPTTTYVDISLRLADGSLQRLDLDGLSTDAIDMIAVATTS